MQNKLQSESVQRSLPSRGTAVVNEGTLSLRDVAAAAFRRKWMILGIFLVIAGCAAARVFFMPNQYQSRMKILVKNSRADAVVTPERTSMAAFVNEASEAQINSEIELLTSRDLLEQVVNSAKLAEQQPAASNITEESTLRQTEEAVRQLEKDLVITPVKKSSIIEISYTAKSPEMAAAVLRQLANLYLEKHLKLHRPPGTYEFFETQAAQYEQQLRGAEAELANFRRKSDVVVLDEQKEINLRKMADVESSLLETGALLSETAERAVGIQQQLRTLEPRILTDSRTSSQQSLVERLKGLLVEMQNRRTQLLTKLQPEDRLVKEIDQQMKDTTSALEKAELEKVVDQSSNVNPLRQTLETDLAKAKLEQAGQEARRKNLATQVEQYQTQLAKLGGATVKHDDLVRQVKALEENYQLYARKRDEARIANALDEQKITNVSIAEAATISHLPAGPNRRVNLLLGLFLAGFVSLGSAVGVEFLRDTVRTPRELETISGYPTLATVPRNREIAKNIVSKQPLVKDSILDIPA